MSKRVSRASRKRVAEQEAVEADAVPHKRAEVVAAVEETKADAAAAVFTSAQFGEASTKLVAAFKAFESQRDKVLDLFKQLVERATADVKTATRDSLAAIVAASFVDDSSLEHVLIKQAEAQCRVVRTWLCEAIAHVNASLEPDAERLEAKPVRFGFGDVPDLEPRGPTEQDAEEFATAVSAPHKPCEPAELVEYLKSAVTNLKAMRQPSFRSQMIAKQFGIYATDRTLRDSLPALLKRATNDSGWSIHLLALYYFDLLVEMAKFHVHVNYACWLLGHPDLMTADAFLSLQHLLKLDADGGLQLSFKFMGIPSRCHEHDD